MTVDLLVNLTATGIAFVLGLSSRGIYGRVTRLRRVRLDETSRQQRHPRYSIPWLVEYYRRRGRESDLFEFECRDVRMLAPFLTTKKWSSTVRTR